MGREKSHAQIPKKLNAKSLANKVMCVTDHGQVAASSISIPAGLVALDFSTVECDQTMAVPNGRTVTTCCCYRESLMSSTSLSKTRLHF